MKINTKHFDKFGYQIFKEVLPAELIEKIRIILEKDSKESISNALAEVGTASFYDVLKQDGFPESISEAAKLALTGHISLQTRLSEDLRLIPTNINIINIAKALLETEKICMHMPPTARFILPGASTAGVPPHQDLVYNRHMKEFIIIWVPLVDINNETGGVVVYENTGNCPEFKLLKSGNSVWKSGIDISSYKPVHCEMNKGDVLALNMRVVHASMPNLGSETRFSIDHRFFPKESGSKKHYLDIETNCVVRPLEVK
jgi:ectoine hydroxylase-related dioxygenase (phytanoyl-CoA dioxygenase family)